jgi:hypothetical protein
LTTVASLLPHAERARGIPTISREARGRFMRAIALDKEEYERLQRPALPPY